MASNGKRAQLPDDSSQHLYRWLEIVQRRFATGLDAVTGDAIKEVGFRRLRVLQLIQDEGSRQQELADRAFMTKQAVADFLDTLEADGLVERKPDPSDGRAWLIVRTAHGNRINADLDGAIGAVEFELARSVGVGRYKSFMAVLRDLGQEQN